jgi:hypothetical protein
LKPGVMYLLQTLINTPLCQKKGAFMKTKLANLFLFTQKINRQHVQVAFALLALVLFVLGAGAPDSGGGGPH